MKPPLIIYHGNCIDGFSAAYLAYRAIEKKSLELCGAKPELLPASYGMARPDVKGREVLVLDFSWPRADMEAMIAEASVFTCLDHHRSAREEIGDLLGCVFDMERSGAMMAFDHFKKNGEEAPDWVRYVQDRDLWLFRYGDETRWAHAYFSSLPQTIEAWGLMDRMHDSEILRDGRGIRAYMERLVEKAVAESQRTKWNAPTVVGPLAVAVVNVPYTLSSECCDALLKDKTNDIAVGWYLNKDGTFVYSLRSRPGEHDVSVIAKAYGGGGRVNSAGFRLAGLLVWGIRESSLPPGLFC